MRHRIVVILRVALADSTKIRGYERRTHSTHGREFASESTTHTNGSTNTRRSFLRRKQVVEDAGNGLACRKWRSLHASDLLIPGLLTLARKYLHQPHAA